MEQADAFGGVTGTTRDGRPIRKPSTPRPDGYAGMPGAGPDGETCGSCGHIERFRNGSDTKHWAKCSHRLGPEWTCSRRTDVLIRSPACQHWSAGDDNKE